ncbi:MAG: DUF6733 family protein [Cytophagales bacterium]
MIKTINSGQLLNMKKLLLVGFFGVSSFFATAQSEGEEKPMNFSVNLNSDAFFGFYPSFGGSYSISDKIDFTTYGILWSGGVGGGWGNWTEFGLGVNIKPIEALSINPQIGILNGSLLSNSFSSAGASQSSVVADGIVPNLTVRESTDKTEGEFYLGYYKGFKHESEFTNNYLHWWINGGFKATKFLSFGLHFEHLRFLGDIDEAANRPTAYDFYMVVGPYLQLSDPKGKAFTRFTACGDLRSDEEKVKANYSNSSFFKLTVGYNF